jgi:hypothetical protein
MPQFASSSHQELRQHLRFGRHSPDQGKRIEGSTGRAKADGGMEETAIDVGMIKIEIFKDKEDKDDDQC